MFAAVGTLSPGGQSTGEDPFAMLRPDIVIDNDDRQALDAGKVVLKILPAQDHELAVLVAGSLRANGAELSTKINDIARFKRSSFVPEVGRFSDPPTLKDLDELTLDDVDLEAIKQCRPGDCALKLSDREIDDLRQTAAANTNDASVANAINREFHRIVLNRVRAYLTQGLSGIPHYATGDHQIDLGTAFDSLLRHARFVQSNAPQLGAYLAGYPDAPSPDGKTTSFLYWSKEKYAWKPIVSVTHVTIVAPRQTSTCLELLVASKEVFATRYTSGALVLTFLIRGTDRRAPHYLVYVNRTWVDGLHALWRPFLNHRIRSQAVKVFAAARTRIERAAG
jgi:hypothetical protein